MNEEHRRRGYAVRALTASGCHIQFEMALIIELDNEASWAAWSNVVTSSSSK